MDDTLPDTQLPLFEGKRPTGASIRYTGSVYTPVRAMAIGDEVIEVTKSTVVGVDHKVDAKTGALTRVHKLKLGESHELLGHQGDMALLEGQEWSKRIADAQQGRAPLEGGDGA